MCNPDLSFIKVGNLKLERDFLHVRDACLAIRQLIFSPQKHLIFNVSSGTGVTLSEIANALGILDKCQQDKLRFRQDEQITWVADNTRMIKTGWKVTTHVIDELKKMSANIKLEGNRIITKGKASLEAAEVFATDLRASACLIIAGMVAKGETVIKDIRHVDRGYELIEEKMVKLGAKVLRRQEIEVCQ